MKTSIFFMYKMIIFIIISCVLCSCVTTGLELVNGKNDTYDVCEAVPIHGIDTSKTTRKTASVEFGINFLYNEEDIQQYSSPDPRMKYYLQVLAPTEPTVKLNSFSFTDAHGDTIPSVLYYRTKNRMVNIIDTLPVVFTAEMVKEQEMATLTIWAECSQSYKSIKVINVNYDIEVGDKQYIKKCRYKKKRYWDIRPKLW